MLAPLKGSPLPTKPAPGPGWGSEGREGLVEGGGVAGQQLLGGLNVQRHAQVAVLQGMLQVHQQPALEEAVEQAQQQRCVLAGAPGAAVVKALLRRVKECVKGGGGVSWLEGALHEEWVICKHVCSMGLRSSANLGLVAVTLQPAATSSPRQGQSATDTHTHTSQPPQHIKAPPPRPTCRFST